MRKLATLWGAALALTLASAGAQAQSGAWPQRTIRIVTPTPAGVGVTIRIVRWGQAPDCACAPALASVSARAAPHRVASFLMVLSPFSFL